MVNSILQEKAEICKFTPVFKPGQLVKLSCSPGREKVKAFYWKGQQITFVDYPYDSRSPRPGKICQIIYVAKDGSRPEYLLNEIGSNRADWYNEIDFRLIEGAGK